MDVTSRRKARRARPVAAASAAPQGRQQDQAQAYCGPAHGRRWGVDPAAPAPSVTFEDVATEDATGAVCYRLARDPRTWQPARDLSGRYVYVPVRYDPRPAGRTSS